jgi:anaerobic selenocysteine-containing dehydrogenase
MTLVHGGRSGRRIRTRRHDEQLGRHGELDALRRDGLQLRREPPRGDRACHARTRSRPAAKMIVIDPRKTRTAILAEKQGGRYIRFRPGTDIAFNNAVAKEIIRLFERLDGIPTAVRTSTGLPERVAEPVASTATTARAEPVKFNSWYTDARFIVRPDGQDYVRDDTSPDRLPRSAEKAADFEGPGHRLQQAQGTRRALHAGARRRDLRLYRRGDPLRGAAFVDHSRMMSSYLTGDPWSGYPGPEGHENYRAAQMMYAMGLTQHTSRFAERQGLRHHPDADRQRRSRRRGHQRASRYPQRAGLDRPWACSST